MWKTKRRNHTNRIFPIVIFVATQWYARLVINPSEHKTRLILPFLFRIFRKKSHHWQTHPPWRNKVSRTHLFAYILTHLFPSPESLCVAVAARADKWGVVDSVFSSFSSILGSRLMALDFKEKERKEEREDKNMFMHWNVWCAKQNQQNMIFCSLWQACILSVLSSMSPNATTFASAINGFISAF